ncbi:MAG: hypothetical protein EZS28_015177 [Streblomastix strix]|uniref:Uncharacterized protein n=1 Tax=Streblomastix strix TaxID=222440 RepID=A0A5J4W3D0_9EUKA|nr:MAG: hypothetical protein EZS28_015177 [Streblomastix strix]
MDSVKEYNVNGSLLGLGEYILLEILSEMEFLKDVQKFLILNKKIHQLVEHPRFLSVIQSIIQLSPIFIIKEACQGRQKVMKFIHSRKNNDKCTIAINPIIKERIVRIEVVVENIGFYKSLGIADASCSFAAGRAPWEYGNDRKTVRYTFIGDLDHITWNKKGNQEYADGQRIAVEVDMTTVPRRATFFVDDIEQPNYVIGIPEAIRFWIYTCINSSSFTVTQFKRLIQSTAKGVKGSKALEWGKEWY